MNDHLFPTEPDPATAIPCPCLIDGKPCGEPISPSGLEFLVEHGLAPAPPHLSDRMLALQEVAT